MADKCLHERRKILSDCSTRCRECSKHLNVKKKKVKDTNVVITHEDNVEAAEELLKKGKKLKDSTIQ